MSEHGWTGWDGQGGPYRATVESALYKSAVFDGSRIHLGVGYSTPAIIGHELFHGVIANSTHLVYQGQSGAINEGLADIVGVLLARRMGAQSGWNIASETKVIRSLSAPRDLGAPAQMTDPEWHCGDSDHGGVHTNSGVFGHFGYLLAIGGARPEVEGLGDEATLRILFHALRYYMTPSESFQGAYRSVVQACIALHGTDAAQCEEVRAAANKVELWHLPECSRSAQIAPDAFEDDDKIEFARRLAVDEHQARTFHDPWDDDWVRFPVTQDTDYLLSTMRAGNPDTVVSLYLLEHGSLESLGTHDSELIELSDLDGHIYARVSQAFGEPGVEYTLTLTAKP